MVGDDGVENLVIQLGAVAGLFGIGYVLSQIIDADAHAGAIDGLSSANRVGDLGASDETAGDAAAQRGSLGKIPQGRVFRKMDEESP